MMTLQRLILFVDKLLFSLLTNPMLWYLMGAIFLFQDIQIGFVLGGIGAILDKLKRM